MTAIDPYIDALSAAVRLTGEMSDISEERYAAGWMSNCEYDIWQALNTPGSNSWWGLDDDVKKRLRELSDKCGGWIVWCDTYRGEKWVPMAEWLKMYEAKGYPR